MFQCIPQRAVFLISEAEVCCDMGSGLEAIAREHGVDAIRECSKAFLSIGATKIGKSLSRLSARDLQTDRVEKVEEMISERSGYDYSDIVGWVASQTGETN